MKLSQIHSGSCLSLKTFLVKLLAFLSITLFLFGCKDEWKGFVYPNKENLLVHRNVGNYSSLEDCRAAALNYLRDLDALETGDYECGKNCKPDDYGMYICQDTLR